MTKREGTIRKTSGGYEIVFERHLTHPPERVWGMITQPEQIRRWFTRMEVEPRVGGKVVEHHDHVGLSASGRVTRYEPPHVFEYGWWEDEAAGQLGGTLTWELHPEGAGTKLVLRQSLQSPAGAQRNLAGWHICLDILAAVLDGADPAAHAPPRGTFANGQFTPTHPGRGRWADRERLEAEYQRSLPSALP